MTTAERRERARLRRRAWRAKNPHLEQAIGRRSRYGVEPETVAALVADQGNVCAICRTRAPSCVDHCHRTGRIRGMLCSTCNAGLGLFRDDTALLRAAAAYLSRSRELPA